MDGARKVTWIPWTPEHNVLAAYKKDCTFCCEPATEAACAGDGSTFATIRSCPKPECRANAERLAAGAVR